jgi:hypothetical protein
MPEVIQPVGKVDLSSTGITLGPLCIVTIEDHHVFIGNVEFRTDERGVTWICIRLARNIRNWGTSKGMGQLALEGPSPHTKIDLCGLVLVPISYVVYLMEVKPEIGELWDTTPIRIGLPDKEDEIEE